MDPIISGVITSLICGVIISKFHDYKSLLKILKQISNNSEMREAILGDVIEILYSESKKLSLYFPLSAGITGSVIKIFFVQAKEGKNNPEKEFNLTIAGMLLGSKSKQSIVSYFLLILSIAVYIIISIISGNEINSYVILFLVICITLIHINQKIIEYRISNGLYGKNEYEAREMINYILSHSDKSDFSDGDKLKKLFPQPVEKESSESAFEGALGVAK